MSYSSYEELSKVIERAIIETPSGLTSFYYDARFGSKIQEHIIHPAYKKCASFRVKPVSKILCMIRDQNRFQLKIISCGKSRHICVSLYTPDNSFICRDYDPSVIIPYILNSEENQYLKNKNHPYYQYGYVADYSWHPSICSDPDATNPDNVSDPDTAFDPGASDTAFDPDATNPDNVSDPGASDPDTAFDPGASDPDTAFDPDNVSNSGATNPDKHSECDSCFDDNDIKEVEISTEDQDEIENYFSVGRLYEPNAVLNVNQVDTRIPKKPLKKLSYSKSVGEMSWDDIRKLISEGPYTEAEPDPYTETVPYTEAEPDPYTEPELQTSRKAELENEVFEPVLVPKLVDRDDNI